ncbi:MAG: nuclear transport factor 2 family protein [Deltaproteobacteria bacterium]|nr:nuclear transport factor 2 family protein [Deltaproteobacteria bacterium]
MSEQENVQVVQQFYAAFRQGDIPSALSRLTIDDVERQQPGPADVLPWAGTRRGREQVAQCLAAIAEAMEFEQLEPREFIAQGDKVVVIVHERARLKATGCTLEQDFVQIFTLRDGKVARYCVYEDTAAAVAAFRGA